MKHSKDRHILFETLWHPFKISIHGQGLSKKGLGFQDEQAYECCMVSNVEVTDTKDDYLVEESSEDHLIKI